MKTTIELPDGLAAEAKQLARERNSTLRELVVAGLRAEIDRRRSGARARKLRFPTAGGSGLRPGVDARRLHEYAYDLPPSDDS
jgi:hypothetical protein